MKAPAGGGTSSGAQASGTNARPNDDPPTNDTLTVVPGVRVGHAGVPGGGSGCTVVTGPFRAAVQVAGSGSGTRELPTLEAGHSAGLADAILLTGGSAFGLAAADGVMEVLEEEGFGHPTSAGRVPIVPGAVLFDLAPGRGRPGPAEGRQATRTRSRAPVPSGQVGAGTGATCGKLDGIGRASPGGVGSAGRPGMVGGWAVGALAAVNAVGDVVGPEGRVVAGSGGSRRLGLDPAAVPRPPRPGENTTLCVVATDAPLGPGDLDRLARMAATALPRCIDPVNTPVDGDVVFACTTDPDAGRPRLDPGSMIALGTAARRCLEAAILRAVGHDGLAPLTLSDDTPLHETP
ncbi:MAG: peptidase S58 family protein [Gemmatimonadales bacterium]|nr:MAG: peptidase S58 family protein [Gemmatimonadales bacterium]